MKAIFLGLAALLAAATASAEDGALLRKQRLPAAVQLGSQAYAGAQFEFACHPARDGALSLSLILADPDRITGFPLRDFEGPDGIGEQRELAQWGVDTRGDGLNVKGPISGWYGVDGDGFLLSRSEANKRPGALHALAKALVAPEAKRLRLAVSPPAAGETLRAEVLLEGRQAQLAELLQPCLQTAK